MPHNTKVDYLCAPDQREFDISVPYLDRNHILAKVNGVVTPFQWVSDSRLRLDIQPAANSVVTIQRITPIDDALVTFHNGSNLTEEELNTAVRQALYRLQEQDDTVNGSLDQARIRLGNSLGVVTDPEAIADEMLRISELGDDLLNRFRDALALVDNNAEEIVTQATALTDQAFRTDVLSNTVAEVGARTDTLETNLTTLTGVVDGLVNFEGEGITAVIENESQARIEGDNALAQTLALIDVLAQAVEYWKPHMNADVLKAEENARLRADREFEKRFFAGTVLGRLMEKGPRRGAGRKVR